VYKEEKMAQYTGILYGILKERGNLEDPDVYG
jgi:hypothetical protein